MDEKTRIEKDIVMFEENLQQINKDNINSQQKKILEKLQKQKKEDIELKAEF